MNINSITSTASVTLADKARQLEATGKKIIKLQTGDPDFDTHPAVIEAAYKALKNGHTHYSFAQGLPALRSLIAKSLNAEINGDLNESNILITQGAAEGIFAVFASILEYEDEVIVLEPNWSTVDSLITMNGAKPIKVSFLDADRLIEKIESVCTDKTKAICFNTPNNPTGRVLSQDLIDLIVDWAVKKDLFIVADEVYRQLQYDKFTTSLSMINNYDKYIFVDSFSKKFAMTGWRIGYVASSLSIIRLILKSSQLVITHVNTSTQYAAIEALTNNDVAVYCEEMKRRYDERRILIRDFCHKHSIAHLPAEGAFYFFMQLNDRGDDVKFANDLLTNNGICVVPGSAYGESGKGFYRITYATAIDNVMQALRIANHV